VRPAAAVALGDAVQIEDVWEWLCLKGRPSAAHSEEMAQILQSNDPDVLRRSCKSAVDNAQRSRFRYWLKMFDEQGGCLRAFEESLDEIVSRRLAAQGVKIKLIDEQGREVADEL